MYYKEELNVRSADGCRFSTADVLKCHLLLKNNRQFTMYCIYRHHAHAVNDFNAELRRELSRTVGKNVLLMGDINVDILSVAPPVSEYLEIMALNGLRPTVKEPTRIAGMAVSCLDHIFLRSDNLTWESMVSDIQVTDHCLVSITLKNCKFSKPAPVETTRYGLDMDKFKELVSSSDFSNIFEETDANAAYDKLDDILRNALKCSTVPKRPSKNKVPGKPWQSVELNKKIKEKYQLINKKSKVGLSEQEKSRLRALNKEIKPQVDLELKKYYGDRFKEAHGDSKRQWAIINQLTGMLGFPLF